MAAHAAAEQRPDAWLSSILSSGWSTSAQQHHSSCSAGPLELHKRLVHLASLREAVLQRLGQLDAVKMALTERKATQQGRLLAALDARLSAAHAAVDPHRCAAWDLIKALEREAAYYSDVLKGLQDSPHTEQWASLTQRYQQLQQQVTQQQERDVAPRELEATLAAGLQPCQVDQVQLVEELRSQADSLAQQLQAARSQQQQQQQDRHAQHCNHGNKQQADQQQALCLKELAAMQQLAALVLQQLQLHLAMQQQGPAAHTSPAETASPLLQLQQEQQQAATVPACDNHQQPCSLQLPQHHGSSAVGALSAQCMRLRQLLQQLSEAADALVQQASAQGGSFFQCTSRGAAQAGSDCGLLDELSLTLQDPADSDDLSFSGSDTRAPVSDAIQQLREAMQGPGAVRASSQPQAGAMDVRLHHALHACGRNSSSSSRQQQGPQQLQVVKLRLAYQQVLHKVQARYQQELRQTEVKHQEALQEQAVTHQQALADLVKQHQEVCGRLAAAATAEADMKQQAQRLDADRQTLQQQVEKLQSDVSCAAASALAVAQVQHEQQLIAAKQEQQEQLQEAKQQVEQLQQQMQELRQQQPSVPLSAEAVAALVAEAGAQQSAQQQEHLHQLEAALQQREQQHIKLLRELADLRHLQEEASLISNSSAATEVTAAMPAVTAAATAAPAAAAPAADTSPPAAGQGTQQQCSESHNHSETQQQQQSQQEAGDAMGALIAAVLGPGPIGRAQQQLHQQRLAEQQQQQQEDERKQQQAVRAQQQQQEEEELLDMQAQLDKLLGLGSTHSQAAAALRAQQRSGLGPLTGGECCHAADVGAAQDHMAAALARARVAETCLQDISSSSACNTTLHSGRRQDLASSNNTSGSNGSSSTGVASKPPWRPASPGRISPQKEQRQWQHWQQHPSAGAAGSPSKGVRSRTPSPPRQQQQQGAVLPLLACVRCGEQEGADLGPCCFHPGLVAAPGPLMYGAEWHACRARCTPDQPGCYIRKDHFFSPVTDGHADRARPAAPSSTGATHGSQPVEPALQVSPTTRRPASSSRQTLSAAGTKQQKLKTNITLPKTALSSGRYVGSRKAGALASQEPQPRSNLPQPSVWKG